MARRGQEARHGVSDRIASALERLRGVDVDAMQREIDGLRRRVADLEQQLRSKSKLKG